MYFAVSGTNIFAGTFDRGIVHTTDNGKISTDDGVWRRPLSDIFTSVERCLLDLSMQFGREQYYSNQFHPSTTKSYQLPARSLVILKIYDFLGREIEALVNEYRNAGSQCVKFNGADLAGGAYYHRLQAGNYSAVKKILIFKIGSYYERLIKFLSWEEYL